MDCREAGRLVWLEALASRAQLHPRKERHEPPGLQTFETIYAGKALWDIGMPKRVLVEAADRVTGDVLDAGWGTGDLALFFAGRGHPFLGIDFLEGPIQGPGRRPRSGAWTPSSSGWTP